MPGDQHDYIAGHTAADDPYCQRHLHHQIFRHVYPWAGQFRQVDIAKGETHFVAHQDIDARLEGLFHSAAADHFYQHRDLPAFARAAAAFLIELN